MNIAIVAPSPVPFVLGGVESLVASLRAAITELTEHQVELIKLPAGEATFWDLVDGYRRFASLDLGHFDLVISTKYPAWMVEHPRHVCYLLHRNRALYDLYPAALGTEVRNDIPEVERLAAFMTRHEAGSAAVLPELFDLLDRLREVAPALPADLLRRPGPLIRRVVRFLDDIALSPRRIRRFAAMSRVVVDRADYFPAGVHVDILPPPSALVGFKDVASEHFFTVSRLDSLKRLDLLVKAMRLAETAVPLLIAGTGPEGPMLRELAGNDRRIRLLGFVPDEEVVDLYGRALAVPFVPYDEDYGLVTVEAMMSGKPVLTCADAGGPLDFVTDGETGIVTAPRPSDVARGIDRLAGDVDAARAMGRRGRDRVRDISWERTVAALLEERVQGRARIPGSRPRSPRRPRITVAVPFPVYPPVTCGQRRVFSLYRHVAAAFDVDLVTLGAAGTPALEAEIAPGVREIRIPKTGRYADQELRLERGGGGAPVGDVSAALLLHLVPAYGDFVARSLDGAAVAVVSHPHCIAAVGESGADVPLVYEAHRLEAGFALLLGPGELARAACNAEAAACARAQLVLACSSEDRAELIARYSLDPSRVRLAPNAADTDATGFVSGAARRRRRAELGLGDDPIALFVDGGCPPDHAATSAMLDMARSLPRVNFLIAGSPTAGPARPADLGNVAVMGPVDDATLATLIAVATVGLNPLPDGSTTNLAVPAHLAAGLPLITTPFGVRGFDLVDGEHALVGPVEQFPKMIERLLADETLAGRLAAAGRRLAEARYDWTVVAASVTAELAALVDAPQPDAGTGSDRAGD